MCSGSDTGFQVGLHNPWSFVWRLSESCWFWSGLSCLFSRYDLKSCSGYTILDNNFRQITFPQIRVIHSSHLETECEHLKDVSNDFAVALQGLADVKQILSCVTGIYKELQRMRADNLHCPKIRQWKEEAQSLWWSRETKKQRMDSGRFLWSQWTQHSRYHNLDGKKKDWEEDAKLCSVNALAADQSWTPKTPAHSQSHVVWTAWHVANFCVAWTRL